jgi:hypothetical protein
MPLSSSKRALAKLYSARGIATTPSCGMVWYGVVWWDGGVVREADVYMDTQMYTPPTPPPPAANVDQCTDLRTRTFM